MVVGLNQRVPNFLSEYAKSIDDSVLNTNNEDTSIAVDVYTPQTEEEQKYYNAQLLANKYDYSGAYKLLEEIKDYKNASAALELLKNPVNAVFKFDDDVSTHYLWIRESISFNSMSNTNEFETAFSTFSAYKWIEYPSTQKHSEPIKLTQTSNYTDSDIIMAYYYKWEISNDVVYEIEIDQDGNDKGNMYHTNWVRLESTEEEKAIERVKDYIKG